MPNSRLAAFAILCVVCVLGLASYLYWAKTRGAAPSPVDFGVTPSSSPPVSTPSAAVSEPQTIPDPGPPLAPAAPVDRFRPRQIYFRYTGIDRNYGKLAVADIEDLTQPRFIESYSCEVVHFAAGYGICLTANRGAFTTYMAQLFESGFNRLSTVPLSGIPSRTRISPDGKMAAVTVFVTGHSYDSVDFSTQTLLIDTATGHVAADLEEYRVVLDGNVFHSADFNFWGVTFTPDSKRFYCTLSSNRKHYLLEGNISGRTATVLHENVECPSLSPDATRIAYKKRTTQDGRGVWQLQVLDLKTMRETPVAERRSVDDQLEWLDNSHVLYAVPDGGGSSATTNVWRAAADGATPPEVLLPKAYSPAVVR